MQKIKLSLLKILSNNILVKQAKKKYDSQQSQKNYGAFRNMLEYRDFSFNY